jgi:hypothetical protein
MKTTDRNSRTDGNGNAVRRPQEIQAEIERTRRQMDGTLNAIEHRLTPGQLYDQGMQYLRNNGGTEFFSNLGEQAKRNPMPVALVGIGLAWLMATQKTGASPGPAISEGDSGLGLKDKAYGLKDKAYETKARLSETASAIGDRAAGMRDSAREQLDRARGGLDTMMREQPLALGAIGLAIGALAAALAPRTRYEDQVVGPTRDRMAEEAAAQVKASQDTQATQPDATQQARTEERERLQQGVTPYAERAQSEPPV